MNSSDCHSPTFVSVGREGKVLSPKGFLFQATKFFMDINVIIFSTEWYYFPEPTKKCDPAEISGTQKWHNWLEWNIQIIMIGF